MKDDRLISLNAAIDAVHKNYDTILDFTSDGKTISYSIEDILSELPSATDTNVGGTDTISRAAALSALNGLTEIYLNNLPSTIYKSDAVDAIKALPSAQPDVPDTNVGDMISRQAAIALFEKYGAEDDAVALLESLPPAQPGWIPCSTALPSEYDNYIITTEDGMVVFGVYDPREEQWSRYDSIKSWWLYGIKVLAWQPKPKPWEGGQE